MADEGGRGGLDPPFLADIICEQPLYDRKGKQQQHTVCSLNPTNCLKKNKTTGDGH